jgi:hypothetical protein
LQGVAGAKTPWIVGVLGGDREKEFTQMNTDGEDEEDQRIKVSKMEVL